MNSCISTFSSNFVPYGDLNLHGVRLPQIQVDEKHYKKLNITPGVDNYTFLKELCNQGFKNRKLSNVSNKKEYVERGKMELEIFKELGFVDYVLLIWDILNFCHENDIATGISRGSCGASLVLYLINVIDIDPVKNGLFFERFISKTRAKSTVIDGITYFDGSLLPDVDSDICYYRRQEVIAYIKSKFPDSTCKISTINQLKARIAIKECMKVVGDYAEEQTKQVSSFIGSLHGTVDKLKSALEKDEGFKKWLQEPKADWKRFNNQQVFDVACKIEGLPKNFSVHPSAMAISYSKLEDICPVMVVKPDDMDNVEVVTGYDMSWVQELVVKVDVLGLRTVSVVDKTCKLLGIKAADINLDDAKIYLPLQELKTPHGLFQVEAETEYRACQKIQPNSLNELSDLMAIARPGAIAYIKDYVERKGDATKIEKVHPIWDEVLKDTKGIIIYQEQVMRLCWKMFGFSLEEAEQVRRATSKKSVEATQKWKSVLYEKAKILNYPTELVDKFWKSVEDSAGYSFNRCLHPETSILLKNPTHETRPYRDISIKDVKIGDIILGYDWQNNKKIDVTVTEIYIGDRPLYEAEDDKGKKICCSLDHKFLCQDNEMCRLIDMFRNGDEIKGCGSKFIKLTKLGESETYDLAVNGKFHNFYANAFIVSNSHSVAYASLSAITLYLKFNHPQQFYLSLLQVALNEAKPQDEISKIAKELPYFDIKLLPPDLIKSDLDFTIEGEDIRFGLSGIKGVSDKTKENLKALRGEKPNKFSLFLAAKQAGINVGVLSALIQAGALAWGDMPRHDLVLEAQTFNKLTDREKRLFLDLGAEYNYDVFAMLKDFEKTGRKDEGGKVPIVKSSRFETIKRDTEEYREIYKKNKSHPELANWFFENKLLGYNYSSSLYDILRGDDEMICDMKNKWARSLSPIGEFENFGNRCSCMFVGIVVEVDKHNSKNDKPMMKITIEDTDKILRCIFFDKSFLEWQALEKENKGTMTLPQEDNIVVVMGSKSNDVLFINKLKILDEKIYIKLADLKD